MRKSARYVEKKTFRVNSRQFVDKERTVQIRAIRGGFSSITTK